MSVYYIAIINYINTCIELKIYFISNYYFVGSLANIAYPTKNDDPKVHFLMSLYSYTQGIYYLKDFLFLFIVFWNASLVRFNNVFIKYLYI
jgi:hypothetical protein